MAAHRHGRLRRALRASLSVADGLTPAHVEGVLQALAGKFQLMGADLVELAPGLSLDPESAARSVETAVRYTRRSLDLLAAGLE